MNKNNITVGIPFYQQTIPEEFVLAIDSILNQTLQADEIHLIQDGKINANLNHLIDNYLSKYNNIRLIKLKKGNIAKSLNESIKLTSTKYYARMDADDISTPDRLQCQYDFLENNNNIDIVGGWAIEFDENYKESNNFIKKMPEDYSDIINFYHYKNPLIHPTVMFRMSFFDKIGYYNENNNYCEDLELWGRSIKSQIGISNIQKPLLYHNIKGMFSRRTSMNAICDQIRSRNVLAADTFKFKILKFLSISFRFMPKILIKYGYKKLR